jgi:hypothetical protein
MDGDEHVQQIEKEAITKLKRWLSNAGNVLFAIWVRLSFQAYHAGNWLVLGGRSHFLWGLRLLLSFVYLVIQALKQI